MEAQIEITGKRTKAGDSIENISLSINHCTLVLPKIPMIDCNTLIGYGLVEPSNGDKHFGARFSELA